METKNGNINKAFKSIVDSRVKEKEEFIKNFPRFKTFTTIKGDTIRRKLYSFEVDYPNPETKLTIFNGGKTDYKLWFLNSKKKLCIVDKAAYGNSDIYLAVSIDTKGYNKQTRMTLDRFLSLVEEGDFTITVKKFVDNYLKDVTESAYYINKIKEFDAKIAEIEI